MQLVFPLLLPCLLFSQLGFTSMFDILSTWSSYHHWENTWMVTNILFNLWFQSITMFFIFFYNYNFIILHVYLDYVALLKGIILICFLVDGFRCLLMILETWQLLVMVLQYWRCYNFLMAFCVQRTTFKQLHFLEVLKDFGTLIMVVDNVMYLIIYFYVNIMLVWRHLWCYLVTFVVFS